MWVSWDLCVLGFGVSWDLGVPGFGCPGLGRTGMECPRIQSVLAGCPEILVSWYLGLLGSGTWDSVCPGIWRVLGFRHPGIWTSWDLGCLSSRYIGIWLS